MTMLPETAGKSYELTGDFPIATPPEESNRLSPEAFIAHYREVLYLIAGTREPRFVPSEKGEFYIDLETMQISLGDMPNMTNEQRLFAAGHEIGHLFDSIEDHSAVKENFEHLKNRAKELVPTAVGILKKLGRYDAYWDTPIADPETAVEHTPLEALLYKELHLLYNAIDDIAVNKRNGNKIPMFRPNGSQYDQVSSLYTKILFPNKELTGELSHRQFAYALLLNAMAPDHYTFSPEVTELLSSYADVIAEKYDVTLFNEVLQITNPAKTAKFAPAHRYKKIQQLVEPLFVDMLLKDFEAQPPENPEAPDESPQGGNKSDENKQAADDNVPSGKPDPWNSPIHIENRAVDPDKVRNYNAKKEDAQRIQAANNKKNTMSPEQRASEAQRVQDLQICEKYGVNPQTAEEYRRLEKEVAPYKEQMADVYEKFMQTISMQLVNFYTENFHSGKFNLKSFIDKHGLDLADEETVGFIPWEKLATYDQQDIISRVALMPSEINFHLVLDGSGSMSRDTRLDSIKKLFVLNTESLATFEARVNLRFRLHHPFKVNADTIMFGNDVTLIKRASKGQSAEEELVAKFRALEKITSNYGITRDYAPLEVLRNSLDVTRLDRLKRGTSMEVILLVTDGGSDDPEKSRKLVDELNSLQVITRGIQIGSPDEEEIETFDIVWGENGAHVESLKDLPKKSVSIYGDVIGKMQTDVRFYELEDQ